MNFKTFLYVFTVLISFQTFSQQKVKGNRNVTLKQTYLDDFHSIILNNSLDVELAFNSKTFVEIEADDNLHEHIKFEVENGVLQFFSDVKITSKKKLHITINYSNSLHTITSNFNSEIRSLTSMELDSLSLTTKGNSKAYINLNSTSFSYKSYGKSKSKLNLTTKSITMELNDNSKLDAQISSNNTLSLNMFQRANGSLEGITDSMTLIMDNSTTLHAGNLNAKDIKTSLEDNARLTISVIETIDLSAIDNTEVYLYGSPKITLSLFDGQAKLQKKIYE